MPIITFIRDILSALRGPYYRAVGTHTHRLCRRAARLAANGAQRRMLLVAAVSADEYIGALLGVSEKPGPSVTAANTRGKWAAKHVPAAMRTYLSVLLILLGSYKGSVLKDTELDERRFLELWCVAFEYCPADMERFDNQLRAEYQRTGIDGLVSSAADDIFAMLFPGTSGVDNQKECGLKAAALKDISAILRSITKPEVKDACS